MMYEQYVLNKPQESMEGEWHLPFVTSENADKLIKGYFEKNPDAKWIDFAARMSVARCARVSYLNHEGKEPTLEEDLALYDRLVGSNPKHCFDGKTEVLTDKGFVNWKDINHFHKFACVESSTGLYIGMHPPDSLIKQEYSGNFYHYEGKEYSLKVTDGHALYGHKICVNADRSAPLRLSRFAAKQPNSLKAKYNTAGESSIRMITAAAAQKTTNIQEFNEGKLCGFFVGDGNSPKTAASELS
jgi:hypothetical protein